MRDFTVDECKRRNKIIETITERFSKWGYSEVSTPIVEYYKTFNHKTQDLKEEEMYKFFDSRGRILVLRPDMTVPVARLVNTKLKDMKLPLKLFYNAEVFRVHESFEGKRNEYLDCGIELIGASGEKTDLEVLVTALEVLKALDTKKEFKLEIGNVNILKSALKDMNLSIDNQNKVIELINKKSLTSLREYLDDIEIRKEYKEFLNKFPWLFGGYEMIKKAKGLAFNEDMKKNIEYLENLYLNLQKLGYEKYISVDISMVPRVNYYSGIIFKGYVKEIGSTVIRGGRYDNLLESFGKSIPAIGFSVDVNLLIDSCDYEEKVNSEKIILSKDNYLEELRKAINKTRNGEKIEIIYK
ncbi:ATP phosphoribosyltransferase regulatory subunit [Clostridium saudiense]|uniref:ATP phosphoribosyltransferase regulatory subunit n=1 Tax=Clostridium saudiense TaxID=1414720 RepID=UPI001A9C0E6D|nr:ATP phosphoribosyltransferase regulatory subunit [Clostridium saudiense]